MKRLRWISVVICAACALGVIAQNGDDEAKEKQRQKLVLAESIQGDIGQLALEENRALALARLGNSLWPLDEKRARGIFQQSVGELIAAQTAAEANRKAGQNNELLTSQSTRPQVLNSIAQRDAEFALESFYKTRPAAIQRAMLNANAKNNKISGSPGNDNYLRQAESNLEQSLMRMAADQNPARAAELIKKALKTALSGETLNLLKKLHEKEPQMAKELASEAVSQLLKKTLVIENYLDHQSFQISVAFLQDFNRERPADDKGFRFDGPQMRQLAEKMIAFYIEKGTQFGYGYGYQLVPIAETLMPAAVEQLKEADKNVSGRGHHPIYPDETSQKLLNHETPVDEILAQAPKLPTESRRQVYQHVANRLSSEGNFDRARAILTDNFSDDGLENVLNGLNWNYVHHLTGQGKFAEAEALIDQFPDVNRYSALVSLATAVYSRDQKNKSYAVNLLEKARGQLPTKPETNMEMSYFMQISAAYSTIEPAEAYRMMEELIPRINELMEAAVVVHGFQGSYNIRRGEMPVSQANSLGVHIDYGIFRNLAKTDLENVISLIGTFGRREMRVMLKQQLLESL
jgi:hypothetical protein